MTEVSGRDARLAATVIHGYIAQFNKELGPSLRNNLEETAGRLDKYGIERPD